MSASIVMTSLAATGVPFTPAIVFGIGVIWIFLFGRSYRYILPLGGFMSLDTTGLATLGIIVLCCTLCFFIV